MYHQFMIGDLLRTPPIAVGMDEARQFARNYDPLFDRPVPGTPQADIYAGKMVSPLFVQMLCLKHIFADMQVAQAALDGAPAFAAPRFPHAVYVYDRLCVEAEIISKRLRDDMGRVHQRVRAWNQNRDLVMRVSLIWPIRATVDVRPARLKRAAV